jgi:hydrogen peroxide-dependent heme synthase
MIQSARSDAGIQPATSVNPVPSEGWHVLHLFHTIDRGQWALMSADERLEAKTALTRLIGDVRSEQGTQLLVFAMNTPKADLGFMLLTPGLTDACRIEKRLANALGPDVLTPCYSYLSMTERSEYTTTAEQYGETLVREQGLTAGSTEHTRAMEEFHTRMEKYVKDRLYPNMPDWPVFCFYNMSKRRSGNDNWYSLDFESRRRLMQGHARVGRQYAGRIRQLITGSTGLDEAEWGVTLFARDTFDIKAIVYEMRFDEVSARYAEFGDFYIGLQLPLDEIFRTLDL